MEKSTIYIEFVLERFRKEYLQGLQHRPKWNKKERNIEIGDIVLINDESLPTNARLLGHVHDVMPSKDGLVRKVKILIADGSLDHKGRRKRALSFLERPIHKLVLVLEKDRGDILSRNLQMIINFRLKL